MNMNCKEAKLLIMPYLGNDKDITVEEHQAFEQHLQSCTKCAKEYEKSKSLVELIKEYWPLDEKMLASIAPPKPPSKGYMTVEEGWQDLCKRCPELAEDPKRQKYLRLFYKVGAAAACLIIGISVWLMFSPNSKPKSQQEVVAQQLAFDSFLTVELISDNQKTSIPIGQKLKTSDSEFKTLVINNKHQVVMNTDTVLAIGPFKMNEYSGCMVELASGQIYSHVKHNGSPFIVETPHGKAVITGTTFDISVADDSTTLVVSEGSVQFESEKDFVEVATGQISRIVGQSAPTKPRACNTAELIAWATSSQTKTIPTKPNLYTSFSELDHLELTARSGPINLDTIDYDSWVGQKRDWFRQEFPQLFELKEALAEEGVEVDYPEIVFRSVGLWSFAYPEYRSTQVVDIESQTLINTARYYGLDQKWLFKNIPSAKYKNNDFRISEKGLKAFEKWAQDLGKAQVSGRMDPSVLFNSLHSSTFLVNTRVLLWLGLRDGLFERQAAKKSLLFLLDKQIRTADRCVNTSIELLGSSEGSCPDPGIDLIEKMVKDVNFIFGLEKAICKLK
jgi:hypothetical protein